MPAISPKHQSAPDPAPPDPGAARVSTPPVSTPRVARATKAKFLFGLVALVTVMIGSNLVLFSLLPHLVPGWTSVGITSGSMEPGIRIGDVVVVNRVDPSELAVGAVVTYRDRDERFVTHRITAVADDGTFTVRGDRNPVADPPVLPAQVVGRAELIIPYAGLPTSFAANGQWLELFVFFVAAGIAVVFARYAIDPRHDPWRHDQRAKQVEVPPQLPQAAPHAVSLAIQLETSTTENDTSSVLP